METGLVGLFAVYGWAAGVVVGWLARGAWLHVSAARTDLKSVLVKLTLALERLETQMSKKPTRDKPEAK